MKKITYDAIHETLYKKDLANGLSVRLLPKQEMEKTYAIFSTDYGSIDQSFVPLGQNDPITVPDGVAHFLEHKLFEKEDRDVFADFSRLGASANAYTSFTNTAYLFSATTNIEENLKVLLDFVQEPYFSDESVEKEKGIIEQEIRMYEDQANWRSFMGTIKALFKHHPVNIDIAGTVDSIYTINKDHLYTCYETFYHPENMTLFVAGNFDPEKMMNLIIDNQAKKDYPLADKIERIFPDEPPHVAKKEHMITMPVSIPKSTVGVKHVPNQLTADEFIKSDLIQQMILNYLYAKSGEFYQQLYKEQLIDQSFRYQTTLEHNFGFTLISSNSYEPEKFASIVEEQLLSLAHFSLTEKAVQTMKNKHIGQLLRGMNSLETIANNFLHYDSHDVNYFMLIETIQSLTYEDFQSFLERWIKEEQIATCIIQQQET